MDRVKFTIWGNQEDPEGNPIGYTRVIKHQWRADATRYMKWQNYVRQCFISETQIVPKDWIDGMNFVKPFKKDDKNKYSVSIRVLWKNGAHADLDNILKGVLDALFENDRNVIHFTAGSLPAPDKKGKVEVEILAIK